MASILDICESEPITETAYEVRTEKPKPKKEKKNKTDDEELAEKREQLCMLVIIGTIETYTGIEMTLGDVKRLKKSDVEKYYHRYQTAVSTKITESFINSGLSTVVKLASYIFPIDSQTELHKDLENDELVKQELNNAVGYSLLKGGRFVALTSGICQIAKHIQFYTTTTAEITEQHAQITEQPYSSNVKITEQTLNNL